MQAKITKAVFPVAGLGTRFLPATKASPKEMLPIVDKPLIQYAVEEAIAAGIDSMVFLTGRNKQAIEDHFDKSYELEKELVAKNKTEILEQLRNILPTHVSCIFIRQSEALGLGHAVLCAKPVIANEPFAVILADDLIEDSARGCMKQMVDAYQQEHCSIIGVERIVPSDTESYGIVEVQSNTKKLSQIKQIVEKPKPEQAPSNLGVVGRYILTPAIFDKIASIGKGADGEIQLTDAIADLLKDETILAFEFEGERYDCGSKLGYLKATVDHGLLHEELREDFLAYLKNKIQG